MVVTAKPERQEQARAEFPDVRIADTVDELFAWAGRRGVVVVMGQAVRAQVLKM